MPIADQAYIKTSGNQVTLHKFKEPVPTSSILILNEYECDRKHLVVAINSDCRQYLTFIFSSQESAIDTEYRKRVLKCPDACTKTKEGSVKTLGPPIILGKCLTSKWLPGFLSTILASIRGMLSYDASYVSNLISNTFCFALHALS